jgi:PAS domain S-box-containing protein
MSDSSLPDFRTVFDTSHHFMGVLSLEGVLLEANRSALQVVGVGAEEVLGKPFWETPWWTHDPLQQDRLRAGIRQAAQGEPFQMETTHPGSGGDFMVVDFTIHPLRDAAGQVVALLPEGRDISELVQERERLRLSEVRFRTLVEHALEAIVILDVSTGRFRDVNAQAEALFKLDRARLEAFGPADLSPTLQPDGRSSQEAARARLRQALQEGTAVFDWVHQAVDGELIPCEVRLLKLPGSSGGLVKGSLVDLRPRLAKEADLRESERKFRLLFDRSVDGLLLLDGDRFTDCNQAVLDMMRCTQKEFLHMHPWELSPPIQPDGRTSDEKAREMMAAAYAKGAHRFEWTHRRLDGEDFPVEVTLIPIPLGGKEILFTTWRDITDRKTAERALRESEERFRLMVRTAQDAFVLISGEGLITFMSSAAERITGFSVEDLFGPMPRLIHPEDWPRVQEAWERILAHPETPVRVEYRHIHKTRGHVWLEAVAQNCLQEPAIGAIAVTVRDMSDRKQAELDRLDMERKLLHTQKLESLGVLAGGIAHDFNNLLTAILGHLSLAKVKLDPAEPAQRHLQATETAVQKAAELTGQMLAYSGKGRFVVKAHDLNRVVREMTHLVQVSIGKKVRLGFSLEADLPPVQADQAQLQQVILNLVTNASDAIGDREGDILITTCVVRLDEAALADLLPGQGLRPGPHAVLEVRDTGGGMSPEVLAKIFDPFFTTKATGHGLGLSAIQGILKGHGAGLKVHSELGAGSTFQVYFPASRMPLREPVKVLSAFPVSFSGRVLLVDDEPAILEATAQSLQILGFDVEIARDGLDAVEKFSLHPGAFRVALLDLTMPRMDGRECFLALRQLRPDLPVILSSGFSEQESVKAFLGQGLAGFIQKPYTLSVLRAAFVEALGRGT